MLRRSVLVLAALALCAGLAFAAEPGVRVDLLDGGARITLEGSYVGARYGASRAFSPDAATWDALGEQDALCTGDCFVVDPDAMVGARYYYRFDVVGSDGMPRRYGPFEVIVGGELVTRLRVSLSPNPSRGRGTLRLLAPMALPAAGAGQASLQGDVALIDLAGRRLATLWSGTVDRPVTEIAFAPRSDRGFLPAGLYFVRFRVGSISAITRVTLVR